MAGGLELVTDYPTEFDFKTNDLFKGAADVQLNACVGDDGGLYDFAAAGFHASLRENLLPPSSRAPNGQAPSSVKRGGSRRVRLRFDVAGLVPPQGVAAQTNLQAQNKVFMPACQHEGSLSE
jgi:hypothetical protein